MSPMKTIEQSIKAKGLAIGWFAKNGYILHLPISRHEEYDLIVGKDGNLLKVKIVSTTHKRQNGKWEICLRQMCSTFKGENFVKKFDKTMCDLVFMVCGENTLYLVPSDNIDVTTKYLPENSPEFEVKF